MGDRLWAGKPSRYVTSDLGQLSLPSLRGRQIGLQRLRRLGLRRSMFACVGWQVTLCDPIWQATPRSSGIFPLLQLSTAFLKAKSGLCFEAQVLTLMCYGGTDTIDWSYILADDGGVIDIPTNKQGCCPWPWL